MSLLSTAKFLIGAVAALGMGMMIDRVGGRWAVLVGTAAGGVAMATSTGGVVMPLLWPPLLTVTN